MNVMIMTDLEGISGVDHILQIEDEAGVGYAYACERLMADTNAAVDGAIAGGADKVYVVDGHGSAKNMIKEKLDPRAEKVSIARWIELTREGAVDAFLEVGAHAMPGTLNGFLDHVQSSKMWFDYEVNGKKCGELAQGAIFMGAFDVPFIMVSGDKATCDEARQLLGAVECAVVKEGLGRNRAKLADLAVAEERIRMAARESMKLIGIVKPYKLSMPLDIQLTFTRTDYCDAIVEKRPELCRLDARRVGMTVSEINSYSDILFW